MQTEWVIQNPQATAPLRVALTVDCNTPKDRVLGNVLENSRAVRDWVKTEPAHDRVAVIAGGGSSLADTLSELVAVGGDIFALNGAATYLNGRGIEADWQIIMDARPETVALIGPAKRHLFASQVDPECFRRCPDALLWHSTYGNVMPDEQPGFPAHDEGYALVGASVSVGNTALVLLYVLGYRTIHVFGMDSSHRDGNSHAYRQPMNDGEPCTIVERNGRRFVCSVAMSLQARYFLERAKQLAEAGALIVMHGDGLLPDMFAHPPTEQEKYCQMWERAEYRAFSPGEAAVPKFLSLVDVRDRSLIDFGCGTGRAGVRLADAGASVVLVDFTNNSRDESARSLPFERHDLTKPLKQSAEYGFCTDVMEHIPTGDVALVVQNVMAAAATVFFQISTVPDSMGALIGQPLHLTVRPHQWWQDLFERSGHHIAWQEVQSHCSAFLVSKIKTVTGAADAA